MPKSKIYLPDVNVWLALATEKHAHHRIARAWLAGALEDDAELAFCRVTQMGLLRLLTFERVMGEDVLSQGKAWAAYRAIEAELQTRFFEEARGFEEAWEKNSGLPRSAVKHWTDAYIEMMGATCGATVVSFDRGFANRKKVDAVVLA